MGYSEDHIGKPSNVKVKYVNGDEEIFRGYFKMIEMIEWWVILYKDDREVFVNINAIHSIGYV